MLLIDSEAGDAGVQTARIPREHDIPVVVDVKQDYPHTAAMLEAATHIVLSEDFVRNYSRKEELPAFKVEVVDTTGCGDVFQGAYALAN